MDMTKFEGPDDPGFVAVTGELRRWIKELQPRISSSQGTTNEEAGEEAPNQHILRITQGGSQFHGPTTVSGGTVFQGNYIGRDSIF
jgi:hypothetical protein